MSPQPLRATPPAAPDDTVREALDVVGRMAGQLLASDLDARQRRYAEALARAAETLVGALPGLPPEAGDRTGRVLAVDDDPVARLLIRRLLEKEGVTVALANGGAEAVAAAAAGGYDAILMDCEMPRVDGYAATERIRAAEAGGRRVAIVALTGHAGEAERARCLAAGMDDHLTKPLGPAAVERVLERWIHAPGRVDLADELDLLDGVVLDRLRADFDTETRGQLLALFLRQAREAIAALRADAGRGDAAAVRAGAHRLKGSCLNLGAARMRELCQRLEELAVAGRLDAAAPLIDELADAFAGTRNRLPVRLEAA